MLLADHVAHLVHHLLALTGLALAGLGHLHVVHHLLQGLKHLAGEFLLSVLDGFLKLIQHFLQLLLGDGLLILPLLALLLLLLLTVLHVAHRLARQFLHVFVHRLTEFIHKAFNFLIRGAALDRLAQAFLRTREPFGGGGQRSVLQPDRGLPEKVDNGTGFVLQPPFLQRIAEAADGHAGG